MRTQKVLVSQHFFPFSDKSLQSFQSNTYSKVWGNCRCIVWVRILRGLFRRDTYFRMKIILGTVLNCFFSIRIQECLWKRSGAYPNLWVLEEFVELRQSAQNTTVSPTGLFGHFSVTLPSISSDT